MKCMRVWQQLILKGLILKGLAGKGLIALVLLSMLEINMVWAALPDTIDKVRHGVVGIGSVFPSKGANRSTPSTVLKGTGFVVGDGLQIVTNYHVVSKPLDDKKYERLAVFTGSGSTAKVNFAQVIKIDPDHDLALLEFVGTPLPPLTLGGDSVVREGEDIAFTGFPIGLVLGLQPVTHRGIISAVTPMVIPALSAKMLTAEQVKRVRKPFDVYQLDATAYPGNSGSAVYRVDSGVVIGVINSVFVKKTKESMLTNPSNISYAIPIKYVRALLATN